MAEGSAIYKAPSGFGPLIGVLQTPALPLGHGAVFYLRLSILSSFYTFCKRHKYNAVDSPVKYQGESDRKLKRAYGFGLH